MLKMRICVHTTRRLQWIVFNCKRNLQQDKGYCSIKKIVGAHLTIHPHIKNRVYTCSPHLGRPLVVIVPFWGVWWASAQYGSLRTCFAHLTSSEVFLTFRFGVLRAVRCTWTKWQWKLVHSPYQHPAATCLRKNTSPCTGHEFSTAVRWLSNDDISWIVGVQYGSPHTSLSSLSHSIDAGSGIEPLTSNVDDVGNVGVDKLDNEDIVDKPSTTIATCFTCDRRRKSACWRSSWQSFPTFFEAILVRISLISV